MADVAVTPEQLRGWANNCDDRVAELKSQLAPASESFESLRSAAQGWKFAESIPLMSDRWEELNEFMRDELTEAAENFRWCADKYDENENIVVEYLRHLFG
ncbi:hypothetical protein SAMN04487819_108250 [Actinopolyspora alba]|uniref:Excreted virulence factor EspC, type VII ESX diderm n=1 Tax=Actinopolyspora alba TaxID=673379 RepID=A0A1I1YCL8_9ACTN|nr:hypothetical protein [Actinopolyspora alba]SFE15863.1 hypothetical protein SAMN04487819_108250 [Actinopolyspora alba]